MTRVAELWGQLTEDQQMAMLYAAKYALGDEQGTQLIRALATDAKAAQRAATATTDPYPYLLPPEAVGPRRELPTCEDCGTPVNGELYYRIVVENGSKRVLWVGEKCWEKWRRRGLTEDGEQLQAFPTTLPIKEET